MKTGLLLIYLTSLSVFAQTSLSIDENQATTPKLSISFGDVKKHEPLSTTFTLKNDLKTPIIVLSPEKNKKNGECTIAEYPKAPIMPSGKATIKTVCKFGYVDEAGFRQKTISLYLNSTNFSKSLQLVHRANVYNMSKFSETPNTCHTDKPSECSKNFFPSRSVCFAAAEMKDKSSDWREYLSPDTECLGYDEMHLVRSSDDIRKILKKYKDSCGSIEKIKIFGHANPIQHQIFGDTYELSDIFKGYSCIMKPDAKVYYKGCNTGNLCAGRTAMFDIAENLLAKGGEVISPSWYAVSFGGVTPAFSANFRNRHLKVNKNGQEEWSLEGATLADSDTLPVSCQKSCRNILNIIRDYSEKLKNSTKCEYLNHYIKPTKIEILQRCADYENIHSASSREFLDHIYKNIYTPGKKYSAVDFGKKIYVLEGSFKEAADQCLESEKNELTKKGKSSGSVKD